MKFFTKLFKLAFANVSKGKPKYKIAAPQKNFLRYQNHNTLLMNFLQPTMPYIPQSLKSVETNDILDHRNKDTFERVENSLRIGNGRGLLDLG